MSEVKSVSYVVTGAEKDEGYFIDQDGNRLSREEYEEFLTQQGVENSNLADAVVGARQKRWCSKGHEWELRRMYQDLSEAISEASTRFASWSEGGLRCPECKGWAVRSENIKVKDEEDTNKTD